LKYSWPALVAMTLNALYAVVDRVFIGHGCGVDAMAGLQLAMPPMMLLTAFGPLIGVGHAAVLSICRASQVATRSNFSVNLDP